MTTIRSTTYDGAGNITSDNRSGTTYNYRYNNRGRLDQLTIGSTVTANYSYDGTERMSVRTMQNMTPAGTTHYIYDRAGRFIAEASSAGATSTEYVWVDDMPLAVVANVDTSSPNLYYVHPDHLNRPTKMTDTSKNLVWDVWYWPFGEVRSVSGSASINLRAPGQYFLIESGLHYNWHRHYDPSIGRYIQPDPLGLVDGPSVYAYAEGNPLSYTDPDGRCPWCLAALGGAAVGAGLDALIQLSQNDWRFECLDTKEILVSAALGAAFDLGALAALPTLSRLSPLLGRFLADEGGAVGSRYSSEKEALVDMAQADKRAGVTRADMKAYEDLNKGLPDPFPDGKVRTDLGHSSGGPQSRVPHGHVGPINHIPILDP